MTNVIIKLLNGETITATVESNEEIDRVLEENGFGRIDVVGIDIGGDK